jgi:hypothetical protein
LLGQSSRVVIESLESRRLLAGDFNAGYALPMLLEFNKNSIGLLDRDGVGTGFTWAQPNKTNTEYQPRLIDVKFGAGILRLYTNGTSSAGSNFDNDNTLVNILQTRFAASSKPWVVAARILGPIPQIDQPHEQGGIIFGPDQDNYVKLVAAAENGQVGLQFVDEQKSGSTFTHALTDQIFNIGSFSAISTLDLFFSGDPNTGVIRALYRVNNGTVKELASKLTLTGTAKGKFFSNAGFAGIMAQNKNDAGGIDVTFDQFLIKRGVLTGEIQQQPNGKITTAGRRVFNDVRGGGGQTIGVSVRNSGAGPLTIPAGALSITGADAAMFSAAFGRALPITLAPGQSASLSITFSAPGSTSLNIKTAALTIQSNDPKTPAKRVDLRGLATAGTGGTLEPSLQRVLDLYQIPDDVGDSNPNDVFLDDPPVTSNDEVSLQQLKKAGPGDVTINVIGVFGVSSNPAVRFGYYEPGSPAKQTELFTINTADAQSVNVVPNGVTSFDPGSAAFAIYSVWPGFKNSDNSVRTLYQQDLFNTFDAGDKRHIRFYPMKNPDGSVVPTTYVMAHEEIDAAKDNQDIVAIISNVTSAAAGPEIGTDNLDGPPAPDRLVFNKFKNADPAFPGTTSHTLAKVRVRNSGSATLSISSVSVSGPFSIVAGGGAQTIAAGKFADVTVQFTGGSTIGLNSGALTINSNDADEPTKVIALVGFNQSKPEGGNEPPLATVVNGLFGFGTTIVNNGQQINTGGQRIAVGEEILSPYWFRANTQLPVTVRLLSSFHTQNTTVTLKRFNKGTSTTTNIFTTLAVDSQTLYPRITGSSGAPAMGSFTIPGTQAFGFRIDNEWSDDTKNPQEQPGGGWGHHVRFYPARDHSGARIPDAYFMVMDYNGVNYDYNDNLFLITNVRPETPAGAAPASTFSSFTASAPSPQTSDTTAATSLGAGELLDSLATT